VAVLFEGAERAVDAQLAAARALVGGEEASPDVWEETRRRQGAARGRVRFDPGRLADALAGLPEAVVRPASGVAYVAHETEECVPEGVDRLVEAIRRELDPRGVLAA
jgi:hypothetical protein